MYHSVITSSMWSTALHPTFLLFIESLLLNKYFSSTMQFPFSVQPPDICSEDTEYNYTALAWEKGIQWPRIAGPYYVNSSDCYRLLKIPVYGLKRDREYSTMVVAYNHDTSLKSDKVYFCKLIILTSFSHTHTHTHTHTHRIYIYYIKSA